MPELNSFRRSAQNINDGILVVGLLALVFLLGCFRQRDADIWWHLKTGQEILERGELPDKDWFTFTSTDRDWIDLHWLFQITAAKLYSLGGMELLTAVSATLGALAVGVLLAARRAGWSWPVTIACWFPVVFLLTGRMYVRPEVVTLVCMATSLTVFFHADDRPRLLWALVPVQILWVNVQGLFILGIVLSGFYWLAGAWLRVLRRPESRLGLRTALLLTLIGVSLCNPYHIRGLLFPLELFRKMSWDADFYSKHISELQSIPQFIAQAGVWQFYVLVHLGLCALAVASFFFHWSQRRFDLFRLLTFAAFAWLGLQATRNSGQFALVAGAVTAWNFGEWLAARSAQGKQRIADRGLRIADRPSPQPTSSASLSSILYPHSLRAALLLLLSVAACLVVTGRYYTIAGEHRLFGLGEHPLWHAHGAARFAAQPGMPNRVIAFHLGHAAVFEFHKRPEQRTFCDPRLEVVSRELLQEYHAIEDAIRANQPGWDWMLARHDLRVILIDHRGDFAAEATLLTNPDWRCVYFDPVAAVFVRVDVAESQQLAAVEFAARLFDRSYCPVDSGPTSDVDHANLPGISPRFHEAESLLVIARSTAEKTGRNDLVRPMLILAMRLAREESTSVDALRLNRLLGQIAFFLAATANSGGISSFGDDGAWDPLTMIDLARSNRHLGRALSIRSDDFISLSFLYSIAAMQGDQLIQLALGEALLRRGERTKQERELLRRVATEIEPLRAISFSVPVLIGDNGTPQPRDLIAARRSHYPVEGHDSILDQEIAADSDLADGMLDAAIEKYRAVLATSPDRSASWWGLARAHLERGDGSALFDACNDALSRPELPDHLRTDLEWMAELARPFAARRN
jgi:hypothetical protein